MAAEVDKSVTFTGEAEAALARSLQRLDRRLRARAIDEAIKSRGMPAEVTGSDVTRAVGQILAPPQIRLRDEPGQREYFWELYRRRQHKSTLFKSIARVYLIVGAITALGGVLFPLLSEYLHAVWNDRSGRFALLISVGGIAMALVGLIASWYAETIKLRLLRQREEREGEFFSNVRETLPHR